MRLLDQRPEAIMSLLAHLIGFGAEDPARGLEEEVGFPTILLAGERGTQQRLKLLLPVPARQWGHGGFGVDVPVSIDVDHERDVSTSKVNVVQEAPAPCVAAQF